MMQHERIEPDHKSEHPWAASILLLTATIVLIAHYYLARPDIIGVFSDSRDWSRMTLVQLEPRAHFLTSLCLLALAPVLVGRFVLRLRLTDMGLGLGNWREGMKWLAAGIPLAVFAGWTAGGSPSMQSVYPLDPSVFQAPSHFVGYALLAFLYYGSWEVLFRGFLLFGLKREFGLSGANAAQTGLSVTAHFGRSLMETASALPAGLVFGYVANRVGSIWYVAVIHWVVGMSTEWFAAMP